MQIELFLGLILFVLLGAGGLISIVGWIMTDIKLENSTATTQILKRENEKLKKMLAKERSFASIVNLEMEDK